MNVKKSNDVNRLLKVESTQPKFDKKVNNESTSSKVD